MRLLDRYGYCRIPAGAKLYRKGEIVPRVGAFFALHPNWAISTGVDGPKQVDVYELNEATEVLFMFTQ